MGPINYPYYFLIKAIKGIRRHPFLNIVTISIITFSMVIFGTFSLIFLNAKTIVDRWGERVAISAYLKEDVDGPVLVSIKERLMSIDGVEEVRYISKEEALRVFRKELGGFRDILDGLKENPLPPSLEIKVKDGIGRDKIEGIARRIASMEGVEEVDYGGEWLQKLSTLLTFFRFTLIVLSVFLFITIVLIVSNTIKLTLFSRKEEIEIMQLVGATDTFIKMPFIIEGFLQGFVGSVVGVMVVFGLWWFISPRLEPLFMILSGNPYPLIPARGLAFTMVFLGSFLGILGSILAMKRFLEAE